MYFRPQPNLNQSRSLPLHRKYNPHSLPAPRSPDSAPSWKGTAPISDLLFTYPFSPHQALATGPFPFLEHSTSFPSSWSWPLPAPLFRALFTWLVPYLLDLEKSQFHGEMFLDNSRSDDVSMPFPITAPFLFFSEHLTICNSFSSLWSILPTRPWGLPGYRPYIFTFLNFSRRQWTK